MSLDKSYSENPASWLTMSAHMAQGNHRQYMEDRFTSHHFRIGPREFYTFVVMDGHGGDSVVIHVNDSIGPLVEKKLRSCKGKKVRSCLAEVFVELNKQVKDEPSGTTVSLLLLILDKRSKDLQIWVASVGDSRVYGVKQSGKKQSVRQLSIDHNVEHKTEKSRIVEANGYDIEDGYVVNNGYMLAMTRSIGDSTFGDTVSASPFVSRVQGPYHTYMLMSDGFSDVCSGKDLYEHMLYHNPHHWEKESEMMNLWRMGKYEQHDNSTLMIVRIREDSGVHYPLSVKERKNSKDKAGQDDTKT